MLHIFELLGDMFWSVWEGLDVSSPFYAPLWITLFIWLVHLFKRCINPRSYFKGLD